MRNHKNPILDVITDVEMGGVAKAMRFPEDTKVKPEFEAGFQAAINAVRRAFAPDVRALVENFVNLYEFKPGYPKGAPMVYADTFKPEEREKYREEVSTYPFFSEGYLYELLGKEDARTILAYLHGLARDAGVDEYEIRSLVAQKQREREELLKHREENRLRRLASKNKKDDE